MDKLPSYMYTLSVYRNGVYLHDISLAATDNKVAARKARLIYPIDYYSFKVKKKVLRNVSNGDL